MLSPYKLIQPTPSNIRQSDDYCKLLNVIASFLDVGRYINMKHFNVKYDTNKSDTTLKNIQLNICMYVFSVSPLLVRMQETCVLVT